MMGSAKACDAGSLAAAILHVVRETRPRAAAACFAEDRAALESCGGTADGGMRLAIRRPEPAVTIGRDQALAREVRISHCRAESIPVVRRPTGGGALWLDADQVVVSLVAPSVRLGATPGARLERGAALLAAAVRRLGVETRFRPPNDLEVVGGAKIASLFVAEEGAATLLFATLIVDFDVRAALTALLVPTEKLTVTGLEHARERVATLVQLNGRRPEPDEVDAAIVAAFAEGLAARAVPGDAMAAVGLPLENLLDLVDPWGPPPDHGFETEDKTGQATLRLRLELDATETRIVAARLATDAAAAPHDVAAGLAAALDGATVVEMPARVARFAAGLDPKHLVGFAPGDLVRLAERAVAKAKLAAAIGLDPVQTSGLMLAGGARDAVEALSRAEVVLVPYCAKPAWCALRPTPDCIDCGHCEVGDAYRLARDRGLDVTTITNFEHLSETLEAMRARGVTSYVGMCCSDFFLKRHAAFRDAGMDAVLMDIVGATCYELKQEHLAYAGAFRAEATLDLDALEKVMALVPRCATACTDGACTVAPSSPGLGVHQPPAADRSG